jgi:hypothetical protein
MSSLRIGFAVIGSLIAATATASADVRYAGSPKFGQFIASRAPAAGLADTSTVFDAKAQMLAPRTHIDKRGIGARGL